MFPGPIWQRRHLFPGLLAEALQNSLGLPCLSAETCFLHPQLDERGTGMKEVKGPILTNVQQPHKLTTSIFKLIGSGLHSLLGYLGANMTAQIAASRLA